MQQFFILPNTDSEGKEASKKDWFIDFNIILTCLGLFNTDW